MFGGARACSLDPCESSNAGENRERVRKVAIAFPDRTTHSARSQLLFKILQATTSPIWSGVGGCGWRGTQWRWLAEQGLDVLSIDFSPLAQAKARALAIEMGVSVNFEIADVHRWNYPEAEFDVVVEIFTQFSSPNERRAKWTGMRQTLKPGGLLILQGYTPKQIEYATGGPKQIQNLYSRKMLEEAFSDFDDLRIVEEEREIHEGRSHAGMSALVGLTARKPKRPEH